MQNAEGVDRHSLYITAVQMTVHHVEKYVYQLYWICDLFLSLFILIHKFHSIPQAPQIVSQIKVQESWTAGQGVGEYAYSSSACEATPKNMGKYITWLHQ